jgi:Tol biopolymer transport system component
VPASGGTATVLVPGEDPYWAPNSRTLIFTRREGDSSKLYLLDVPTKQVKDIPKYLPGEYSQPAWSRN